MNSTELEAPAEIDFAALRPTFDTLLNEVDGIFANARIAYALTLVDRTLAHEEWPQAVELLVGLADKLARRDLPGAAWRELLWAAAWCGMRAPIFEEVAQIETIFERYATQAWSTNFAKSAGETIASADKRRAMPWDLADLFKMADASEKHLNGLQFGHLVQTVFPDFPLGHYARAHFADRLLQVGHHNLPKACTPQLIARNFARAEALAENLEMPEFVRRPEAAAQCTRRALQNGIPGNPALETRIITTLVERAVQHADDEVLREWLEVAEAYRAR